MKARAKEIDLGKDGSKWAHGYIPENAAAVALKNHKSPGGSGKRTIIRTGGLSAADARKKINDSLKSPAKTAEGLSGPQTELPAGQKVTAHEVHGSMGEIRHAETGRILASGFKSKRAATLKANAHNLKVDQDSAAKANLDYAKKRKAQIVRQSKSVTGSSLEGKDFRSMSSAQRIRAAELMHGTGSKQHKAAIAKWAK